MEDILKYQPTIRRIGHNLVKSYQDKNEILTGINGPYDDEEYRVRNLCHLIIVTAIEILKYGKKEYMDTLAEMFKELLGMRLPSGFFDLRHKAKKDSCNGVIGHAWVLEGLLYVYKVYKDEDVLKICLEIAQAHKFSEELGLWYIPLPDKDNRQIDYTFNHQLWYAASIAELLELAEEKNLRHQLDMFMEKVGKNMCLSLHGKISHNIIQRGDLQNRVKQRIKRELDACNQLLDRPSYAYKEQGYHIFNLMAFARIYNCRKNYTFFSSPKFEKALAYVNTRHFKQGLLNADFGKDISLCNPQISEEEKKMNIYGFPYNVPGFELLYVDLCFSDKISDEAVKWCLENQFEKTYDKIHHKFGICCHDKNTVNYRIYEFYRYLELI